MRPLHAKIVAALALAGLPFAFLAALSWGRLPPTWLAVLAPAALIALVVAGAWIARAAARHCDSVRLLEARAAREEGRRLLAEAGAEASSLRDALGRALAGMRELRTGELAGDLGRARSLIQALAAAVAQNDAQAQQAHRLVQEAEKRAGHGAEVASRTIGAMDEISGSSARIASIIAVIDSIAAQTGLLALNAAVEAARAGEHGRGFSVVAAEVRSLAARSAGSAREIKDLVQNSARYVQEGEALVEASGEALAELMAAVKKVEGIVAGIAAASKAQSSGIGEAAQALSRVEQALLRIPGLEA